MILGDNAGPSKIAKIEKIGIKTLDEDGFINLIATRGAGQLDDKTKKKLADDQKKIRVEAERMIAEEAAAEKERAKAIKEKEKAAGASQPSTSASQSVPGHSVASGSVAES